MHRCDLRIYESLGLYSRFTHYHSQENIYSFEMLSFQTAACLLGKRSLHLTFLTIASLPVPHLLSPTWEPPPPGLLTPPHPTPSEARCFALPAQGGEGEPHSWSLGPDQALPDNSTQLVLLSFTISRCTFLDKTRNGVTDHIPLHVPVGPAQQCLVLAHPDGGWRGGG